MSWFPGYAIDVGTGERLNMAFGEDSWASADNGDDMIFNPSSRVQGGLGNVYAAGQHWIYVFRNQQYSDDNDSRVPAYDLGQYLYGKFGPDAGSNDDRKAMRGCGWVGSSITSPEFEMLSVEDGLIPTETRIKLRVAKDYRRYAYDRSDVDETEERPTTTTPSTASPLQMWPPSPGTSPHSPMPLETCAWCPTPTTPTHSTRPPNSTTASRLPDSLKYAPSAYTPSQVHSSEPSTRQIPSLTSSGTSKMTGTSPSLVASTSFTSTPPGAGEKIVKWFAVMRPVDLENF